MRWANMFTERCRFVKLDVSTVLVHLSWFHPNHFCSGLNNNITFKLPHYNPPFPPPHGDITSGPNSVWETINEISYIQSEIKGLIGCWLRTLWRGVQTQSSGPQSSRASCPTRQKTFSGKRDPRLKSHLDCGPSRTKCGQACITVLC